LHDKVVVPDDPSVTLVGATEHVRPLGEVVARVIVPRKLFWLVIVTVDWPWPLAGIITLVGLKAIAKFETLKETMTL
jgi:hypothetical protein